MLKFAQSVFWTNNMQIVPMFLGVNFDTCAQSVVHVCLMYGLIAHISLMYHCALTCLHVSELDVRLCSGLVGHILFTYDCVQTYLHMFG